MDIGKLILDLEKNNQIQGIMTNNRAQFGPANAPLIGADLLPERTVDKNSYREEAVKFRTFAANPSTRYSPVTFVDGALASSFLVELGESDYGQTLDSNVYDALRKEMRAGTLEQAASRLLQFTAMANDALIQRNHIWRMQALVDGRINAKYGNVQFTVDFARPTGHRVTVPSGTIASPAGWYDQNYDQIADIVAMIEMLGRKGYIVSRIMTSQRILTLMLKSKNTRQYMNSVVAVPSLDGTGISARGTARQVNRSQLEQIIRDNTTSTFSGFEVNDQYYNTRNGSKRYFREDAMLFVCSTGRSEEYLPEDYDGEDGPLVVPDTLGYFGVGVAAGQDSPGRVITLEAITKKKPPRVEQEAWQTSGPVILEPEAIAVIFIPKPSAA